MPHIHNAPRRSVIRLVGAHNLTAGPRHYSAMTKQHFYLIDAYSPEDALRRIRACGYELPAASVVSLRLMPTQQPDPERVQRVYDAARNVDWDDPEDVARFKAAVSG